MTRNWASAHTSSHATAAHSRAAEAESRPKSAHRYNVAEQQQIYKSEIERIWKAQYDSLSRKDEPQLTDEDERENRRQELALQQQMQQGMFSRASSVANGQREGTPGPDQRKVLRIKRKVNGEWRTEIVRDVAVINAYVKKRQAIEEENTTADALAPTGDAEKDRRMKKRCVLIRAGIGGR